MLNLTSSCDRSDRNGTTYNYIITADLTHNNHGDDTYNNNGPSHGNSSDNTLPDDIPLNFITTFGTINTPISTRNGKALSKLNSTAAGTTNVTITLDNQTITIPVDVKNINVLGISNTRTGESFSTIQATIDSKNTLDGDTITLADGTYTENVVVYKKLIIKAVSGANVTVQASNPYIGVFTIVADGSTIQNMNIIGAAGSYGILSYANNVNITGNTITANSNGITLFNSNGDIISGNSVINNWYGINLYNSTGTTISENNIASNWYGSSFYNSTGTVSGNNITGNWYGVLINAANNVMISGNVITDNNIGVSLFNSTSTTVSGNTITNNQVGISYYKSNSATSGNTITNNSIADTSQIDTTGVIIQNNIWNCGPASLATVLNDIGVNATQDELASLAETDKSGTSMYGLAHAAQVKGLNATGIILSIDQLKPNYIVLLLTVNGLHYSVITSITNTTVYLADSSFGNINMTLEDFTAIYTGYTLVITNNSAKDTTLNGTILNNQEMLQKKGTILPFLAAYGVYIVAGIAIGALAVYVADQQSKGQWHDYGIKDVSNAYNNWRNSNSHRSNNTHNTIYVGGGGYSYGYSYSYPHGHNTRGNPPRHIPYIPPVYTYSLYVATGTGWAYKTYTTTSNPAIIKDQQIYKQYLIKRASEIAKIAGIAGFYLQRVSDDPNIQKGYETLKNGLPVPSGKDDDDKWIDVGKILRKDWKTLKEGITKKDPKKILIGGRGIWLGTAIVTLDIMGEHSELIVNIADALNELANTVKKSIYTTS